MNPCSRPIARHHPGLSRPRAIPVSLGVGAHESEAIPKVGHVGEVDVFRALPAIDGQVVPAEGRGEDTDPRSSPRGRFEWPIESST